MGNSIQDYFNQGGGGGGVMGGGGDQDSKEKRKKIYLAILVANIVTNILYFFLWMFGSEGWGYILLEKIFSLIFPFPTISIFVLFQLLVTYILTQELISGQLQKTKGNIISVLYNVNLLVFSVLGNAAYQTYISKTNDPLIQMNAIWIIIYIVSTILFVLGIKVFIMNIWEVISDAFFKKEEETPEEVPVEEPIEPYEWVQEYYKYDMKNKEGHPVTEDVIGEKLKFYRYYFDKYFISIIQLVNQTLVLQQSKLLAKAIYDQATENQDKTLLIQVDYPEVDSRDEFDNLFRSLDFSNKFININNSFIAFKLKTSFLNNPAALEKIGEEIFPTQILPKLSKAVFFPNKKLDENSDEFKQMISESKGTPYPLFQSISIQKLGGDYYVVLNYTKWYRRINIFPKLDTLTTTLEKQGVTQFENKPDPLVYFGLKATGGLVGLKLSKIRHLIFGGESGSGKSVFLNSLVYQILYRSTPEVVKLVLIDPLKVSFQRLKKIKNLDIKLAMTEEEAIKNVDYLYRMNNERYTFLESLGYEDIYSYNKDMTKKIVNLVDDNGLPQKFRLPDNTDLDYVDLDEVDQKELDKRNFGSYQVGKYIPQVILIYDEFNAYNGNEAYDKSGTLTKLIKLGEQARKAGIILVLGTQKISADSVPSALRENIPTKICLTVGSKDNSRAILGTQPENKSDGAFLSGYGDSLVFNKVELNPDIAIRSQGFYVSEEEMNTLIRDDLEEFGPNDFLYTDGSKDLYKWINYFYSTSPITLESGEELDSHIIARNEKEYSQRGIDIPILIPQMIDIFNEFFISQRDQLLDKTNLGNKNKNLEVATYNFNTEDEMLDTFGRLKYSNDLVVITKSFIQLKLDTKYLASLDKLEKLEEKLNLQMVKLKKSITFSPIKPFKEDSDDYKKMLNNYDGVAYQLIEKFEIVIQKSKAYIQLNFTPMYKQTVVFPTSKTVRQILTTKYGEKIEHQLKKEKFIIK